MRNHNPKFSSGPTTKFKGWTLDYFSEDTLGRSHRSKEGVALIQQAMGMQRELLGIPKDYHLAIIPGSATAAFEAGIWNLVGEQHITVWKYGIFSGLWAQDVAALKVDHTIIDAPFESLPPLTDPEHDLMLTWTETSTGVHIPNLNWLQDNPNRLVFCDATATAFCEPLPWNQLDVIAFSWQKGLGAEAAHGSLVLSPRALKRLQAYHPPWAIPRVLRLKLASGEVNTKLFEGYTINTPSLLCVQDFIQVMGWALKHGAGDFLHHKTHENYNVVRDWVNASSHLDFMVKQEELRAMAPVQLVLKQGANSGWDAYRTVATTLAEQGIGLDILNHALATPGFRLWTGPTVEACNLSHVLKELDRFLGNN